MGQIAEACHRSDLTFGLEVEANLVGQNGPDGGDSPAGQPPGPGARVRRRQPALPGLSRRGEVFEQYLAMKPGIGWLHIKDYRTPGPCGRSKATSTKRR